MRRFTLVGLQQESPIVSITSTWQRQIGLDYGKVRLIGSAAFILGVVVFGGMIGWVSEQHIVWILTALFIFLYHHSALKTDHSPKDEIPEGSDQNHIGFIALLKNPMTLRVMIAVGPI